MARRGRGNFTRRGAVRRKNNVWTVVLLDRVSVGAGGQTVSDIVTGTDWQRSSSGKETATVLTVRGWMSYIQKVAVASVNPNNCMEYIGVADEDAASPDAMLASTYTDEDIMWTGGHQFAFEDSDGTHFDREFNVKAQRLITTGQDLRYVLDVGVSGVLEVSGVIRALVRIHG